MPGLPSDRSAPLGGLACAMARFASEPNVRVKNFRLDSPAALVGGDNRWIVEESSECSARTRRCRR